MKASAPEADFYGVRSAGGLRRTYIYIYIYILIYVHTRGMPPDAGYKKNEESMSLHFVATVHLVA